MVSGPSPYKRGGSQQQDRRIRRDSHVRSRSAHLCAQGRVQGDAIGAKRSEGTHLSTLCHRHEECHGENQLLPSALGPAHPYRLRHGGASRDFALKLRRLEEIQRRGRWKSFASVSEVPRREEGSNSSFGSYQKRSSATPLDAASNIEQIFLRLHKELLGLLSFAVFLEIFSGCGQTWQRQLRVKQDGVS